MSHALRVTSRGLLLITVIAAIGVGWIVHYRSCQKELSRWQRSTREAEESNLDALSQLSREKQRLERLEEQIQLNFPELRTRFYRDPSFGPSDLSEDKLMEDLKRAQAEARRIKRTPLQPTTLPPPP